MTQNNSLHSIKIEEYLKSIGKPSDVDIQIIKGILSQANFLCPEELKDIFVSNYNVTDNKEQFKDVWFFSDNYLVEVRNFNKKESPILELAILSQNVQSVSIEAKDLDLSKKAKDNSWLNIKFYTFSECASDQVASGHNCDIIKKIYNKYIKPNIVRIQ